MKEKLPKMKMHWGFGIAALYGGFVVFTLAIVGYASFQHFDLVEKDYYARSLEHDSQMARVNRVTALPEKPRYEFDAVTGEVVLRFPRLFRPESVTGTLTFFRPSAASLDVSIPVALDSTMTQRIPAGRMAKGKWRAKLSWSTNAVEYYDEQDFTLE